MRKICGLICLYVLLFTSAAFAADPFEVHEGGFGPTIKGIQLGMPNALIEVVNLGAKLTPGSEFEVIVERIWEPDVARLSLIIQKADGKITRWKIFGERSSSNAKGSFSQYNDLNNLLEVISETGFSSAYVSYGNITGEKPLTIGLISELRGDGDLIEINRLNRVSRAEFNDTAARSVAMDSEDDPMEAMKARGAREAAAKEAFAKTLVGEYKLPAWEQGFSDNVAENPIEGYAVALGDTLGRNYLTLRAISIPDK